MPRKETVTQIVDGDTFWTTEPHCIRLANVNTPESGESGYQKAKEILENLVLNKAIEYNQVGESHGRIVAEVTVGGTNVNSRMRIEGYA